MKQSKIILLSVVFWLMSFQAYSQPELVINLKSGNNSTHILNSVRSLTFSGNDMTIQKEDGTSIPFAINTINNLRVVNNSEITGIEEIDNLTESKVYPNPVTDLLTISYQLNFDELVTIDLYDLSGEIVLSHTESGVSGNNVSSLPLANTIKNGIYVLKIRTKNVIKTIKVIKY